MLILTSPEEFKTVVLVEPNKAWFVDEGVAWFKYIAAIPVWLTKLPKSINAVSCPIQEIDNDAYLFSYIWLNF